MTWKEFKDFVDKCLLEDGADENVIIRFIDTSSFPKDGDIDVFFTKVNNEIAIH